MKKVLKILLILVLAVVVLVIGLLFLLAKVPAVPKNYTKEVETGGQIEAKYLAMGSYEVKNLQAEGSELTKNYYVYYPAQLEEGAESWPAVVVLNGTGVLPEKYPALFRHLASWGFVVIGTDDPSSGFATSADESVEYLIKINEDPNSIFYNKIDMSNLGITGHSQGGAGVFTAISIMEHKDAYKTAVALSPTNEEMAHAFGWNYDLSQVTIPVFLAAGTEGEFETQSVISIEQMTDMYGKITSPKVKMRRIGADHGKMLYSADGYVTAWFMWLLKGDAEATAAFTGEAPELAGNALYQDVEINLG